MEPYKDCAKLADGLTTSCLHDAENTCAKKEIEYCFCKSKQTMCSESSDCPAPITPAPTPAPITPPTSPTGTPTPTGTPATTTKTCASFNCYDAISGKTSRGSDTDCSNNGCDSSTCCKDISSSGYIALESVTPSKCNRPDECAYKCATRYQVTATGLTGDIQNKHTGSECDRCDSFSNVSATSTSMTKEVIMPDKSKITVTARASGSRIKIDIPFVIDSKAQMCKATYKVTSGEVLGISASSSSSSSSSGGSSSSEDSTLHWSQSSSSHQSSQLSTLLQVALALA